MKTFDQLTPNQQQIVTNLRKGLEIYYPPDSADMVELINDGWLIPIPERPREYLVSKNL